MISWQDLIGILSTLFGVIAIIWMLCRVGEEESSEVGRLRQDLLDLEVCQALQAIKIVKLQAKVATLLPEKRRLTRARVMRRRDH